MTTHDIRQVSHRLNVVWHSDLMPRLALAGSLLFVTGLVVGLV